MISILKYIRGYVQIKVWGFAPERFLNLCSNKNILLWDIRREAEVYYMCISLSGFRKLRKITRKTKTRVVILQRFGLPFLIPKVLARQVFIVGLLAACFFWFWTSLYVWEISLSGNLAITEEVFLEFLEDEGVRVGMRIRDLDIEQMEKDIRKQFEVITWTSAKLSGTNLEIAVKENDALLAPMQNQASSDLYADFDGVIVSMIVRSGVPQVKIGDSVEMGQLLVSGQVPVFNEDATVRKYQYVRSDADIFVERVRDVYETLPFIYIDKVYTGREEKEHFLAFGERELSVGKSPAFLSYDVVTQQNRISPLKGLTLPFSYGTHTYREYQNTEREYSLEEAEILLYEKYDKFLANLQEKGVQILGRDVKMDSESGVWTLEGELTVQERIGLEVPIEVETQPIQEPQETSESE